jgi:hypothetical protein
MVKNEQGLWVKAQSIAMDKLDDSKTVGKGRGRGGVPVFQPKGADFSTSMSSDYHHKTKETNREDKARHSRSRSRSNSRNNRHRVRDMKDKDRYRDRSRDRDRDRDKDRKYNRSRSHSYSSDDSRRRHSSSSRSIHRDSNRDKDRGGRERERQRERHRERDDSRTRERYRDKDRYGSSSQDKYRERDSHSGGRKGSSVGETGRHRDDDRNHRKEQCEKNLRIAIEDNEHEQTLRCHITAVQVVNRFHELYAAKTTSPSTRLESLNEIFEENAVISSLKNVNNIYLSSRRAIVDSFAKTTAQEVTVSKRMFVNMDDDNDNAEGNCTKSAESPITFVLDFHRACTAPGLGDQAKATILLYQVRHMLLFHLLIARHYDNTNDVYM